MPTELGPEYDYKWRGRPPHMLRQDVPVWHRFLDRYGYLFERLYYDCLLGGPYYTEEQLKDPIIRQWRINLSKRADAIAVLKTELWIIEVSEYPGLRALGQLLTYTALWREDPKLDLLDIPVLVCAMVDEDMVASAARYGVRTYVV